MKEIRPAPICLLCGSQMTITKRKDDILYSCHTCASGNEFHSNNPMFCPVCFHPLMAVYNKKSARKSGPIYLCSSPACPSHVCEEGDKDNPKWKYYAIRHTNFKTCLKWQIEEDYFYTFGSEVDSIFHNHLANFVNRIIEAQKWIWERKPAIKCGKDKMKEIIPKPLCLACGNPMELVRKGNRYSYFCHSCSFGNQFYTTKEMICPTCFSQLMVVKEKHWRITLCSNPKCSGYREGERGQYIFRTISHKNFNNYLDWNCMKNYFRFLSVVSIEYHNHLVEVSNKIIEAQGWNWEEKPEIRVPIKISIKSLDTSQDSLNL